MIYFIYRTILAVVMRSTILVGGQAVIEGVMMRVPGAYATAVRAKDGEIKLQYNDFKSIIYSSSILSLPVIRGGIHLYESMKIGYKTLEWSVDINDPKINNKNQFLDLLLSMLSILFAVGLFFGTPIITADFIQNYFYLPNDTLTFNLISGLVRIILFLSYLYAISFLKDVQRLFEFHGAEHKTVYNFESGQEITVTNAQSFSKEHPRCGTSFVFIVMLVSIISFTCIDTLLTNLLNIDLRVINRLLIHIPCIPLVAGISYEVLKITAKYQNYFFFRMLAYPGLLLQKITTQNPSDDQLEVAISALKSAFKNNLSDFEGKKFNAEAIG